MFKRAIMGVFMWAVVFSVTAPVSALTIQEIQAQIQALVSRITILQAQPAASPSGIAASPVAKHRVCAALYRNLSHGSRGDDVMSLQEFLRAEGYLSANATGYFGPATRGALARWQTSQGISAVGSLGPLTRARIAAWCGTGSVDVPVDQGRLGASPQRGAAPLAVTFTTNVQLANPRFVADAGDYKIVFGDGGEQGIPCAGNSAWCYGPHTVAHTYTTSGTYTASLVHYGYFGIPGPSGAPERVVATITIYVGASTPTDPSADPRCRSWYDGCNDCSRQYPGAPAMCTLRACIWQAPAYCKEYFDGGANKPPVVSGFSGPTTLNVNQTGTWTINASDPENGPLSYQITWGDENVYVPMMMSAAAREFVQMTTFTHAYASAGTYTISIVVRDSSGQEARSSTTVHIGQTPQHCTLEYNPVCGQKTVCPACYYSQPACLAPCSMSYQTYSNRCFMAGDGATFAYDGACR